jgi:hypothetical protein
LVSVEVSDACVNILSIIVYEAVLFTAILGRYKAEVTAQEKQQNLHC